MNMLHMKIGVVEKERAEINVYEPTSINEKLVEEASTDIGRENTARILEGEVNKLK